MAHNKSLPTQGGVVFLYLSQHCTEGTFAFFIEERVTTHKVLPKSPQTPPLN